MREGQEQQWQTEGSTTQNYNTYPTDYHTYEEHFPQLGLQCPQPKNNQQLYYNTETSFQYHTEYGYQQIPEERMVAPHSTTFVQQQTYKQALQQHNSQQTTQQKYLPRQLNPYQLTYEEAETTNEGINYQQSPVEQIETPYIWTPKRQEPE